MSPCLPVTMEMLFVERRKERDLLLSNYFFAMRGKSLFQKGLNMMVMMNSYTHLEVT